MTADEERWLQEICDDLKKGRCIPFLGAGASISPGGNNPPLGAELSNRLADHLKLDSFTKTDKYPPEIFGSKDNLLRVALYYEFVAGGRDKLTEYLKDEFSKTFTGNALHDVLSALPSIIPDNVPFIIITTNFDNIIEERMSARKIDPYVVYHHFSREEKKWQTPRFDSSEFRKKPTIYKIHGSLEDRLGLVITEHDYVSFLHGYTSKKFETPVKIQAEFSDRSFVFVGYGMEDWDFRVMFQGILPSLVDEGIKIYSVNKDITDLQKKYWQEYRKINLLQMTADEFGLELKKRLNLP